MSGLPSFLYIDPGTGSMLFSVVVGLAATMYFLARSLVVRAKTLVIGKKSDVKTEKVTFVIYSEGRRYWNVFLPIVDAFERRGVPLVFLTSSSDDPVFDTRYAHVSAQYIGEGNRAYAYLNFLSADVCVMTTPGLDVYQIKRSKGVTHYSHVLHSVDDATSYRLFGIDYFDSILLSGEYQKEDLRSLESFRALTQRQLPVVGCTYLDVLEAKKQTLVVEKDPSFTVLVSPSWGPSGILSRFGSSLLTPLAETGWRILVRPHPQSVLSEKSLIDCLQKKYEGFSNVEWDFKDENLQTLNKSDVMISDFSGIIFDFSFLFDRPIFYVSQSFDDQIYDSSDIERRPWKFRVLEKIGIELTESMFPSIRSVIESSQSNSDLKVAREKARETAWQFPTESGERIADFLISTQKELQ